MGARRARQGLGPFVARDLVAAGAEVPAFLATSSATAREALIGLREFAGIEPRAHLELERMLEDEDLDALAILSPPETHADYLRAACAAGLPVLCEKPFVWGGDDPVGETESLLSAFAANELAVWENCQWPYTLPAFETLHPGSLAQPPLRFEMELEPMAGGLQGLIDSLSHPLSLLQVLRPGAARISEVALAPADPSPGSVTIRFSYVNSDGGSEVRVQLRRNETPPRRAAYALDGRRAERVVSPSSYRLSFRDGERVVPLADPLTLLVADFVAALREPGDRPQPSLRRIHQRMQFLAALAAAYATEESP